MLYEREVSNFKSKEVELTEKNEDFRHEVEHRFDVRIRDVPLQSEDHQSVTIEKLGAGLLRVAKPRSPMCILVVFAEVLVCHNLLSVRCRWFGLTRR